MEDRGQRPRLAFPGDGQGHGLGPLLRAQARFPVARAVVSGAPGRLMEGASPITTASRGPGRPPESSLVSVPQHVPLMWPVKSPGPQQHPHCPRTARSPAIPGHGLLTRPAGLPRLQATAQHRPRSQRPLCPPSCPETRGRKTPPFQGLCMEPQLTQCRARWRTHPRGLCPGQLLPPQQALPGPSGARSSDPWPSGAPEPPCGWRGSAALTGDSGWPWAARMADAAAVWPEAGGMFSWEGRSPGGRGGSRPPTQLCRHITHAPVTGTSSWPKALALAVTRPRWDSQCSAVCSGADSEGSVERLECVPGGVCPGLVSAVPGAPPALGVTGHSLQPVAAPWPWAQTRGAAVPTRTPFPASVRSARSLLLPAPRTERWSAGRGQAGTGTPPPHSSGARKGPSRGYPDSGLWWALPWLPPAQCD